MEQDRLTLDFRSGYYNITVAIDSIKYTTFTTKYGEHECLRVPLRICVAPSYSTLMINETLKGSDFCFAYLDDIIIYSKTEKNILTILNKYLTDYVLPCSAGKVP